MSMTKEEKLGLKIGKQEPNAPATSNLNPGDEKLELEVEKITDRHGKNIKVLCRSGWVTLVGRAQDAESKKAVEAEAAGVPGVKGVTNHIHVRKE